MANQGEVDLFSRGVENEPQRTLCTGRTSNHKVIDDFAVLVEQLGITLAAWLEIEKVGGAQRFEEARNGCVVAALNQRLTHMRNVEQPSSFASMEVLGKDP